MANARTKNAKMVDLIARMMLPQIIALQSLMAKLQSALFAPLATAATATPASNKNVLKLPLNAMTPNLATQVAPTSRRALSLEKLSPASTSNATIQT